MVYGWSWVDHSWGFLPWALLLLPLLLRRNRTLGAAAVVVPALVVYAPLLALGAAYPDGFGAVDGLFGILAVSIGVLFLLAPWLTAPRWWQTYLRGLGVIFLAVVLGLLCLAAGHPGPILIEGAGWFLPIFFAGTLVTGLALAGWSCALRFSPVRFVVMLAGWLGFLGMVLLLSVTALIFNDLGNFGELAFAAFIGCLYGFVCLLLLLPFLILVGFNRTYRQRFMAALRLPEPGTWVVRGRRWPPFF